MKLTEIEIKNYRHSKLKRYFFAQISTEKQKCETLN